MFNKIAEKVSPKTAKILKVTGIALAAVAGVVAVGYVLYKVGWLTDGSEAVEITEAAVSAA